MLSNLQILEDFEGKVGIYILDEKTNNIQNLDFPSKYYIQEVLIYLSLVV